MSIFKRKSKEEKDIHNTDIPANNQSSETKSSGDTMTIADIEKAIEHYRGTPDAAVLLDVAGLAYLRGDYGAKEDIDKAISCYESLDALGDLKGRCMWGKCLQIKGLETGEKFLFSLGCYKIYDSYKNGYDPAIEELRMSYETGLFENIDSFEDFLAFCEDCSNIKDVN